MTDEVLEEKCPNCGVSLIRTSADDEANPYDGDAIVCGGCLQLIRVEPRP